MKTFFALRTIGLMAIATASAFAVAAKVRLMTGTVIPVTLERALSSDHSWRGETFNAVVRQGYLGLPAGTRLDGVVRSAVKKTKTKPGVLVLAFTRIATPSGRVTSIDGTPVAINSKSVRYVNGRMVAKSGVTNQRLAYVGYGAGAGALVSILTGGGRIIQNTVLGAALGYLAGSLIKSKHKQMNNVMLKSGTSFGVVMHRSTSLSY